LHYVICTIISTCAIFHVGIIVIATAVALVPVWKCCNLESGVSASINAPVDTEIVLLAIIMQGTWVAVFAVFPAAKIGIASCTLTPSCAISRNSVSHVGRQV
jgi:hypothetical protein